MSTMLSISALFSSSLSRTRKSAQSHTVNKMRLIHIKQRQKHCTKPCVSYVFELLLYFLQLWSVFLSCGLCLLYLTQFLAVFNPNTQT